MKKNTAFQYFNGTRVVCDKTNLTLDESKKLFNAFYDDMVEKTLEENDIEVAIWVNMENESDYRETLIHLCSPDVKDNLLCETVFTTKF